MKTVPPWIADRIADLLRPDSEGGIPGWCTPAKAEFIVREVIADRLTRAVEIGVFGGRSLVPVGMALKELGYGSGFAVGIDPYCFDRQVEGMRTMFAHVEWAGQIDFEGQYNRARKLIYDEKLEEYCGILRCASHECASLFGTIDYLHIDGCHSERASCRDVVTWEPKVRPGGLIFFDDCNWPTVQEARGMLSKKCEPPYVHSDGWECYRKL